MHRLTSIDEGQLDVRVRTITDGMALAAADALAGYAERLGISEVRIVPRMDEWKLYPHVAAAAGVRAQEENARRQSRRHHLCRRHIRRRVSL